LLKEIAISIREQINKVTNWLDEYSTFANRLRVYGGLAALAVSIFLAYVNLLDRYGDSLGSGPRPSYIRANNVECDVSPGVGRCDAVAQIWKTEEGANCTTLRIQLSGEHKGAWFTAIREFRPRQLPATDGFVTIRVSYELTPPFAHIPEGIADIKSGGVTYLCDGKEVTVNFPRANGQHDGISYTKTQVRFYTKGAR